MLLGKISRHVREHDWFAVAVDVLIVGVGLLMAFQADRWWEERGERLQEQGYIQRLINDIETDVQKIRIGIELAETRLEFAQLLMDTVRERVVPEGREMLFMVSVMQSAYTYTPSLTSHTFEDLRTTGNMRLLRDEAIKGALYAYYGYDEGQRQYMDLNFMIEFEQFRRAAGILSIEQHEAINHTWYVVTREEVERLDEGRPDPREFARTLERFLARHELHAWLPKVAGVQREQIVIHGRRIKNANEVLAALRNYLDELKGML